MKKHQTSHFSVAVITATVVMLFIVTTVYAAPKNYYGLTTSLMIIAFQIKVVVIGDGMQITMTQRIHPVQWINLV